MTQPTERRFVMEPRLDAEVETINDALDLKVDLTDPRLTDERTPLDNSVTSAKIADGAIVDEDINDDADIAPSKILGTAVTQADTGTVTGTMIADGTVTGTDIDDETITSANLAELDFVKFDTTYTGGSTQPGEVAWNADQETLEFQLDPHVTLQIGQEHVMRIKNNSGSVAIPNGTVVMFAGATGDTIKVSPAVSDGSINVNYLAGITTEEIPADGFGFVTQLGFINGVNTNAYTVGTILYVDPATPGGLTATEPESPAWTMPVAAVTKQNSSAGRLLVRAIPGGSGAGGGASVNVSDTAPAGGNEGDLWLDSTDGTLYVYYEDVDGSQWIQVQANSALGASIESRLGALESQAIALGTYSPNYIINGGMDIWQRGTSFSGAGGYICDRWWTSTADLTNNTIARNASIVPEGNLYSLSITKASTVGVAQIRQSIETLNAVKLAGQKATFSVYLYASASTDVALFVDSSTATDDGPAASMAQLGTTDITVGGAWVRASLTVDIPSNAKSVRVRVRVASLGVGVSLYVANAQLEQGSTATSFRRNGNSIQEELANCQRYFQRYSSDGSTVSQFASGIGYSTTGAFYQFLYRSPFRIPPTSLSSSGTFRWGNGVSAGTFSTLAIAADTASTTACLINASGSSGLAAGSPYRLDGPSAGGFIDFSAEL